MRNRTSPPASQGAGFTIPHDLGIENDKHWQLGDTPNEAGPVVKAAVRAALADQNIWSGLDHENYKPRTLIGWQRSGRGQFVLEAVLEFLVEEQGYTVREAMDTLVLEAVRVAANAEGAAHRARKAVKP